MCHNTLPISLEIFVRSFLEFFCKIIQPVSAHQVQDLVSALSSTGGDSNPSLRIELQVLWYCTERILSAFPVEALFIKRTQRKIGSKHNGYVLGGRASWSLHVVILLLANVKHRNSLKNASFCSWKKRDYSFLLFIQKTSCCGGSICFLVFSYVASFSNKWSTSSIFTSIIILKWLNWAQRGLNKLILLPPLHEGFVHLLRAV